MTKTSNSKTTLRLVNSLSEFKALKDDWNELYKVSNCNSIFSSWDWMVTWWEVFQDQFQRELFILCLYNDDQLVGIAPFQIDKSYPRALVQGKTLRFIGLGDAFEDSIQSEYLDLIALPGMENILVDTVSKYLIKNSNKWNFADFEFLLEDALILQCFKSLDCKIARQEIDYGVRFSIPKIDSFEEYQKNYMGKRWSKMFTKKSRVMERDGDVTVESTDTIESIEPALERLADMHCARWKGRKDTCIFNSSRFYEFHKKLLYRLVPQKKASIRTLMVEGEAFASYYLFEDKGQIHYYQSGFYAKHANRYSSLFILICNEIRSSIENQKMFDFMFDENPQSYKKEQYAATSKNMYRLKWTPQPYRLSIFRAAKSTKIKFSDVQGRLKNKVKTMREN